jgi:hypothetical protein
LLETPDEELVGRRHLVIRQGSNWHIPRSNHADNSIASFLTLNKRARRWDCAVKLVPITIGAAIPRRC